MLRWLRDTEQTFPPARTKQTLLSPAYVWGLEEYDAPFIHTDIHTHTNRNYSFPQVPVSLGSDQPQQQGLGECIPFHGPHHGMGGLPPPALPVPSLIVSS